MPRGEPTRLPRAGGSLTALTTRSSAASAPGSTAGTPAAGSPRSNLEYRVGFRFVDLSGKRVDPRVVRSLTLPGSNGRRHVFRGSKPRWLSGNRVSPESGGTKSTAVSYAAQKALVGGSSVVHRGQQRFFPAETRKLQLRLLLFSARFEVRDALLGFPIGSAVLLEYPNGELLRQALGAGGELTLKSLPRGDYRVSVDALGISSSRPIALSGDQDVRLQVISWLDIAIVLLALGSIALALLYIRRPSRPGCRPDRHAAGACRRSSGGRGDADPTRCSPTTTSGSTPAPGIAPRPTTRCSAATRATTAE